MRGRLADREILGLALGLDVAGDAHPLAVRDRFQEAWVEFLSELTAGKPTVVLVEDLHWAEEPLLDLLERLARDVRGPLLVIGTARPELLDRRATWGGGRRNASLVWLDGLSPLEADAMLEELVPGTLDPDTRRGLGDRPDLLDRTRVRSHGRRPRGLGGARGPRLHPPAPGLDDQRGDGVHVQACPDARGRLRRPDEGAPCPPARLLRRLAGADGSGGDEHAALLAHHYSQAASPEDADLAWADAPGELEQLRGHALRWLRRAELAIRRYDLDEAVADLRRALELCGPAERGPIWREVGRASALKFDGDTFLAAMTSALDLIHEPKERAELLGDLAVQTSVRAGMWPRRPEHEQVEGWIGEALELAEPGSPTRARALIARAFWNPSDEREAALEATELAEESGDAQLRSSAWGARASTAFAAHDYEESVEWAQRRLELVTDVADPDHVTEMYEMLVPPCALLAASTRRSRLSRATRSSPAG